MISGFHDESGGGFFDLDSSSATESVGALTLAAKPFQDSPTPAGDSAAALALLRLHALNGDAELQRTGQETLEVFAGVAEQYGIYAGTYGVAAVWMARAHTQVVVVGEGRRQRTVCRGAGAICAEQDCAAGERCGEPEDCAAAGAGGDDLCRSRTCRRAGGCHALQRLHLPASDVHGRRVARRAAKRPLRTATG